VSIRGLSIRPYTNPPRVKPFRRRDLLNGLALNPQSASDKVHLFSLPAIFTCDLYLRYRYENPKDGLLSCCKSLYLLIGIKWHGRGRRFEPDQVHQFPQQFRQDDCLRPSLLCHGLCHNLPVWYSQQGLPLLSASPPSSRGCTVQAWDG
jgi:hypothetical protein